jgi:NitT/TauT family transport system ATP-binding protein
MKPNTSPNALPITSSASLTVEHITQKFHTASGEIHAIDDVSFSIASGKFIGIVGPSGCGKSSLLLMMAGLLTPTIGRVLIGSTPVIAPIPEEIGVVFHESSLLPWKTARENVEFPLKLRGVSQPERQKVAIDMLKLVGLQGFIDRYPHELSGGMKQRVSVARGFCQDSRVLLMDEPFAALDEQTRMTLGDELLALWEKDKKTVVFVTHSLTEAVYLCDEVLVMGPRPGRVLRRLLIDLPRPRSFKIMATERFGQLRNEIWDLIRTGADS